MKNTEYARIRERELHSAEIFCINHGDQHFFFKFEIIINVLVGSFCFICIRMLWVYGHSLILPARGTVFIRQNLTSTDVRFWRIKTVPALKGWSHSKANRSSSCLTLKWAVTTVWRTQSVCLQSMPFHLLTLPWLYRFREIVSLRYSSSWLHAGSTRLEQIWYYVSRIFFVKQWLPGTVCFHWLPVVYKLQCDFHLSSVFVSVYCSSISLSLSHYHTRL